MRQSSLLPVGTFNGFCSVFETSRKKCVQYVIGCVGLKFKEKIRVGDKNLEVTTIENRWWLKACDKQHFHVAKVCSNSNLIIFIVFFPVVCTIELILALIMMENTIHFNWEINIKCGKGTQVLLNQYH